MTFLRRITPAPSTAGRRGPTADGAHEQGGRNHECWQAVGCARVVVGGFALGLPGNAVAGSSPAAIGPDQCFGSPQGSPSPECGGQDYENGYTEQATDEDWLINSACRQVRAYRQFKTWWGHVAWRYYQRVRWCWNGNVVTSLVRDRWPDTRCCFWQFFGHVSSNCS